MACIKVTFYSKTYDYFSQIIFNLAPLLPFRSDHLEVTPFFLLITSAIIARCLRFRNFETTTQKKIVSLINQKEKSMEQDFAKEYTILNPQQQDMLRLFKNPMSESDYIEIKRFIVKKLSKNIDEEMERLEKEKGWTQETYEQWGKEHLRIPYHK